MTSSDWSRLRPVLERLLALPEAEHAALLDEVCAGDEAFRGRVLAMLDAEREDPEFLEVPAPGPRIAPGSQLGPWRLLEIIGRGGMGEVWIGSRADGHFDKRVAIKLLGCGLPTSLMREHFDTERRALARLEHPNIARLLDGGTTPDGVPWLAMEHVEGSAIDAYCDERDLNGRDRLRLFLKVCDAVAEAHRRLVIHRDIKPGNIFVGGEGEPKLLDFGIAKMIDPESEGAPGEVTQIGHRPYTPRYASPEQVRGEAVTTATDVYSLGVVLRELLDGMGSGDGATPQRSASPQRERGTEGGTARTLNVPHDADPTTNKRASRVTGTISETARLPRDLDTILTMALREEPERRYPSVQHFADDLRRHLEGLPVMARPDTLGYRSWMFVRRHRKLVAAAVIVVATLVTATAVSWSFAADARRQRDEARLASEAEAAARAQATGLFDALLDRSLNAAFGFAMRIREVPGATRVSLDMLAQAVTDLEHLEGLAGDDPRVLTQLARAYTRLGDAQGNPAYPNVGDTDAALASYERAFEIADALPEDEPASWALLALCHSRLGEIADARGQPARARRHMVQALDYCERRVAAAPGDREARKRLAFAHEKLGTILCRLELIDEALPHIELYRDMIADLHREDPDDGLVALHVAFGQHRLGQMAWARGDYTACRDAFLAAADQLATLVEQDPNNVQKRQKLGWSWLWAANAEVQLEHWDAGAAALLRAAKIYETLLAEDTENTQVFGALGACYEMLGNVERSRGEAAGVDPTTRRERWIAARDWYAQAVDLYSRPLPPQQAHLPAAMAAKLADIEARLEKP